MLASDTQTRLLIQPKTAAQTVAVLIGGALAISVATQVKVDLGFTPVPFTLQVFAVLACGLLMGWKAGACATALYLLIGSAGAPVFTSGQGGIAALLSGRDGLVAPTLGYLAAFPAGAAISGWMWERRKNGSPLYAWLAAMAGVAAIYAGGFTWVAPQRIALLGLEQGLAVTILQGIVPFIFADVAKAMAAAALVSGGHLSVRTLARRPA